MKHQSNTSTPQKCFWGLNKKQWILCIAVGVLLLALMTMIIAFSTESKSESGERSKGVTEMVAELLVPGYQDMTPEEQQKTVQALHRPIRKLAHFSEFCLLGMLCAAFMHLLKKGKYWLWWVIPTVFCLLYATADEVWQIFTHRGSSVTDVIIDFCGSVVGICLIHLIWYLVEKHKRKKRKEASCESQNTP